MRHVICAMAAIAMFATGADADDYQCPYGGLNAVPLVPTAKVAGNIYKAVVNGYSPYLLQRFPDITVKDLGDHWLVGQMNAQAAASRRTSGSDIVMLPSRGQLSLSIDKCTGTIIRAEVGK